MKPMNCPGHFLIYASEVRSYRDLPIRFHEQTPLHRNEASGVLVGPHARPPVLAGRCALLRHAGTDRRRSRAADSVSCSASTATSACRSRRSCRRGRRVPGRGRDLGLMPRRSSRRRSSARACRTPQREGRRVLRPEDRLRRHRRDRPEVAVRDDSARLQAAGELRPEIHRRRQRRASAGRHPSGDFRQLRAVHRDPDRALRRAPFRSGWPRSRPCVLPICRPPPGVRGLGPGPAGGGRAAGRCSTSGRKRSDIRSERRSCRRCPTCWSWATASSESGTVSVRDRASGDLGAALGGRVRRGGAGRDRAQGSGRTGRIGRTGKPSSPARSASGPSR